MTLGLNDRREADRRDAGRRERGVKVNWSAVGVIAAIAIALLSWLGNGANTAVDVASRITTLETKSKSGDDRLDRMENRMERIEDKLDRALDRQR